MATEPGTIAPVLVPGDQVRDRDGSVTILSKVARKGAWALPRHFRVAAFMGEVDLDLTQILIAPGVSEIEVLCIMGQVNIVAPHGLNVECTGHAVMGQFGLKQRSDAVPAPEAPVVRITGTAFMGEVKVRVVDPAAPGWLARQLRAIGTR